MKKFESLCSQNGRYLDEMRACLTEDLYGRPCNGEVLRDAASELLLALSMAAMGLEVNIVQFSKVGAALC